MYSPFSAVSKRYLMVFNPLLKNYYETLGIGTNATQSDIKKAYYKLSKMYHPDKNQGSKQAVEKFQRITEAYEVLGNYQKRRLYDRGFVINIDPQDSIRNNPESTYVKKRPAPTGRTPIYDFDEWSRAHYGQTFNRRNNARNAYYENKEINSMNKGARDQAVLGLGLFLFVFFIIQLTCTSDLDNVTQKFSANKNYGKLIDNESQKKQ